MGCMSINPEHGNLKEQYIKALNNTLDEIKKSSEDIFKDINDKYVYDATITISIEPNTVVGYTVRKYYFTQAGDE